MTIRKTTHEKKGSAVKPKIGQVLVEPIASTDTSVTLGKLMSVIKECTNPDQTIEAIEQASKIGDKSLVPVLMDAAYDEELAVHSLSAIGKLAKKGVDCSSVAEELKEYVGNRIDPNTSVAEFVYACEALDSIGEEQAVRESIKRRLTHRNNARDPTSETINMVQVGDAEFCRKYGLEVPTA